MKMGAFAYHRPGSLDEVLALLGEHGDGSKILSGDQSLVPLMARTGCAIREIGRRHGDFATVGASVCLRLNDSGNIASSAIAGVFTERRRRRRQGDQVITSTETCAVALRVNGADRAIDVEPRRTLAEVLREDLGLTGTHLGCEHGVCGACTVIVGDPVAVVVATSKRVAEDACGLIEVDYGSGR